MGASCTVQAWGPIREEDIITKVRYEKPLGDISGVVRVYYKSHLYDDEREYDCVRTFIWASKAEDYVKFVVPIINTAPTKGNRYYALWEVPQVKKKQYCRYCSHCFEGDGYCCSDPPEGKDGYLSDDAIKRPNHCNNFCETKDIITGREYKPRNAAIAEKKSTNAENNDVQLTFF